MFQDASAQRPPNRTEIYHAKGLFAAVARSDQAMVQRLLAAGERPDVRDEAGRTPLHYAAHFGRGEVARALVAGGADPRALDAEQYDIVTIAAVRGDVAFVKLAIELGGDPRAITSPYRGTALIAAAHRGHDDVVRALIAAGAPLDHVNNLGWTALMEAVVLGTGGARHTACVEALLAAGANPNLADRQGITPLAHAKSRGFTRIGELLEAKGGH